MKNHSDSTKHIFISHSDQYIKTPAYQTYFTPFERSKIYSNIKHNSSSINYTFSKNNKLPSVISMIGHDRLLNSLQNFGYKENKNKCPKNQIGEDRFIPSRKYLQKNYKLKQNQQNQQNEDEKDPQSISIAEIYSDEVLGSKQLQHQQIEQFKNHNILKYKPEFEKNLMLNGYSHENSYGTTPNNHLICQSSNKLRKVSKIPCKVLDAPALQDDFYLNLIDWSVDNQLAVGLGNCIYLWNACNSKVTKLCELNNDMASSVAWSTKGNTIAIGCNSGIVQIWDVNQGKLMKRLTGHQIRVGSMAWNTNLLATGSRDKTILQRDLRTNRDYIFRMQQHTQQICGLKWSLDQQYLASGGNDNKVVVWSSGGQILNKFSDHKAAVKAIAWSPHQHGLLATGGGTADRMIKMRNVFTGNIICQKDAGSQVCNIAFSKSLHEVVSTHGYSQHQINIWSYPNMKKVATLIGHSHRVLYLATSPDGSTIVTGAGDQTLRFWNVFPPINQKKIDQQEDIFGKIELR